MRWIIHKLNQFKRVQKYDEKDNMRMLWTEIIAEMAIKYKRASINSF